MYGGMVYLGEAKTTQSLRCVQKRLEELGKALREPKPRFTKLATFAELTRIKTKATK